MIIKALEVPEKKVGGQDFYSFVMAVAKQVDEINSDLLDVVKLAVKNNIIDKKGSIYYYKKNPLGRNYPEVMKMLESSENASFLVEIQNEVKKH